MCHGKQGEGTVLAEAATDRVLYVPDFTYIGANGNKLKVKNKKLTLKKEDKVSCGTCHENPLEGASATKVASSR